MIRTTDSIRPLLACTVALTGAAFAGFVYPDTNAFFAADLDENETLTKVEFGTSLGEGASEKKINKSFKKADADKNESISLSEFLVFRAESKKEAAFIKADTNLNGTLSLEEYVVATQGKGSFAAAKKRFLLLDQPSEIVVLGEGAPVADGVLTLDEWLAKPRKAAKGEFLVFDLVNVETEETPNSLTPSEFALALAKNSSEAKVLAKFGKLDKNDDGVLTRDEWNPGAPKSSQND